MLHPNGNGGPGTNFTTTRLDLATKLALMAAVIYGTQEIEMSAAVHAAGKLVELCDKKAHWLKAESEHKKVAR